MLGRWTVSFKHGPLPPIKSCKHTDEAVRCCNENLPQLDITRKSWSDDWSYKTENLSACNRTYVITFRHPKGIASCSRVYSHQNNLISANGGLTYCWWWYGVCVGGGASRLPASFLLSSENHWNYHHDIWELFTTIHWEHCNKISSFFLRRDVSRTCFFFGGTFRFEFSWELFRVELVLCSM